MRCLHVGHARPDGSASSYVTERVQPKLEAVDTRMFIRRRGRAFVTKFSHGAQQCKCSAHIFVISSCAGSGPMFPRALPARIHVTCAQQPCHQQQQKQRLPQIQQVAQQRQRHQQHQEVAHIDMVCKLSLRHVLMLLRGGISSRRGAEEVQVSTLRAHECLDDWHAGAAVRGATVRGTERVLQEKPKGRMIVVRGALSLARRIYKNWLTRYLRPSQIQAVDAIIASFCWHLRN